MKRGVGAAPVRVREERDRRRRQGSSDGRRGRWPLGTWREVEGTRRESRPPWPVAIAVSEIGSPEGREAAGSAVAPLPGAGSHRAPSPDGVRCPRRLRCVLCSVRPGWTAPVNGGSPAPFGQRGPAGGGQSARGRTSVVCRFPGLQNDRCLEARRCRFRRVPTRCETWVRLAPDLHHAHPTNPATLAVRLPNRARGSFGACPRTPRLSLRLTSSGSTRPRPPGTGAPSGPMSASIRLDPTTLRVPPAIPTDTRQKPERPPCATSRSPRLRFHVKPSSGGWRARANCARMALGGATESVRRFPLKS